MTNSSDHIPFSNGTEYMIWLDNNCCRCTKYNPSLDVGDPDQTCEIEDAICASMGTGVVSGEIWKRMGGGIGFAGMAGDCTERTWDDKTVKPYRVRDFKDPNQTELIDDQQ